MTQCHDRPRSEKPRYICAEIRRLREERGWTLDELAAAAAVPASHLSRLERGWAVPRLVMPARLVGVLGISPQRLLDLDGQIDELDLCLVVRLSEFGMADPQLEEILTLSLPARRALARGLDHQQILT